MISKDWGKAYPLYEDAQMRVVQVDIESGWQCSVHTHHRQDNVFVVISGLLEVIEHPFMPHSRSRLLAAGESHTVPAGVPHCFRSKTAVRAVEVYSALAGCQCDVEDIERHSQGRKVVVHD